jgi:hypothetical protein
MNESFSVGRALSLGLSITFRNFIPFLGLALLVSSPQIIWTIVQMGEWNGELTLEKAEGIQTFAYWFLGLGIFSSIMLISTYSYGVVSDLRGQHASVGATLAKGLSRFFPVIGSAIILIIIMIVVSLVMAIMFAMVFSGSPELAMILVGCGMGAMYSVYYVTIPSAVMERPGVVGALGRSSELTSGRRGGVFALLVLIFLAKFGMNKVLEGIMIDQEALMEDPDAIWTMLKNGIWAQMAVDIIFSMFTAAIACVTYYLLRSEKEGTSADELAAVFD